MTAITTSNSIKVNPVCVSKFRFTIGRTVQRGASHARPSR
jgi:hypothetical protein